MANPNRQFQVADAAAHSVLAAMAKTYLAYCECKREGQKKTIAAAFTAGDVDFLFVGRNGVFYDRAGYDGVTDLAYYIDPAWQGRGVGTFMLDRLLTEALARHMRKACGIIFADNAGSIALMHRFGFTQFGLMPQAATDSTGTMRDMSYWHLDL